VKSEADDTIGDRVVRTVTGFHSFQQSVGRGHFSRRRNHLVLQRTTISVFRSTWKRTRRL